MPGAAAPRKGRNAEREAAALLTQLTGWPVRRRLQEGRADDAGDLEGVRLCCVQVTATENLASALSRKLPALEQQRQRSGQPFGVLAVRRRGGQWVFVLDPDNFVGLLLAACDGL